MNNQTGVLPSAFVAAEQTGSFRRAAWEIFVPVCSEILSGRLEINMKEYKISLAAINDVKEFVNKVMKYDFDVDLISGRYAIDGKSIMGIFSLDLSKPIELKVHTDDTAEFEKDIEKFIVK